MLSLDQRRALQLLADAAPRGCSKAFLFAYGFTSDMLIALAWDGLATTAGDDMRAGEVEVVRLRITVVGRRALGPAYARPGS